MSGRGGLTKRKPEANADQKMVADFRKHYERLYETYHNVKEENEELEKKYMGLLHELMELKEEIRRAQVGPVEDCALYVLGAVFLCLLVYSAWNLYGLY
jgi:predicted RNase H-like nuclease (RuvC/YqgF family)